MSSPLYQLMVFDECASTQEVLKSHLEKIDFHLTQDIAILALSQPSGRGQGIKKWHHFKDNLAVSFSLTGFEPLTLTALELGVMIVDFFSFNFQLTLKLKWPNDILNLKGEKVGGIICHVSSTHQKVIVGLGLNLFSQEVPGEVDFNFLPGFIFPTKTYSTVTVTRSLLDYIYNNRLDDSDEVILKWKNHCDHNDKVVTITDKESFTGKFFSIGEHGQAILEIAGVPTHFYNGSLIY